MKDKHKTKQQLLNEIIGLREKVADLIKNKSVNKEDRESFSEAFRHTIKQEEESVELFKASTDLLHSEGLRQAAESFLRYCKDLIGAADGCLILSSGKGGENEIFLLISGEKLCAVNSEPPILIRRMCEQVYETDSALYDNNLKSFESLNFLSDEDIKIENILLSPLEIDERFRGIACFFNKPDGFNDKDIRSVSLFIANTKDLLLKSRQLELLKNTEESFRSIAVSAPDAMIGIDVNGIIIFWNKAAEAIFDYTEKEILDKSVRLLIPERFRQAHQKGIKRFILSGGTELLGKTLVLAGVKKDATEFPLELSLTAWQKNGDTFFTAIVRDITAKRQYEREIQAMSREVEKRFLRRIDELRSTNENLREELKQYSQAKKLFLGIQDNLQAILDQTSTCIYAKDIKGGYVFANTSCAKHLNIEKEQMIGRTDFDLLAHDTAEKLAKIDESVFEKGKPLDFEESLILNDKEYCFLSTRFPLFDSKGFPRGVCGISMDITERKKSENKLKYSEKLYRELLENVNAIAWEANPETLQFTFVSPNAEKITGFPASQWLNQPNFWAKKIHPDDRNLSIPFCKVAIQQGKNIEIEYRMIKADGNAIWMRNTISVICNNSMPLKLKGLLIEVHDHKHYNQLMKELFLAIEQSIDWVLVADIEGNIEYTNKAVEGITGYSDKELIGQNAKIFKVDKHNVQIYKDINDTLLLGKSFDRIVSYRKKNGGLVEVFQNFIPLKDQNENIIRFVSIAKDISQKQTFSERLHHHAYYDLLTGLPNRNLFIDSLNQTIASSEYKRKLAAVLIIDIERFNFINDTYGFETADEVLKNIGNILLDLVREGDTVARLQNDEFGISFIDFGQTKEIISIVEKIIEKTSEPMKINGKEILLSVCIGISVYPEDGKDAQEMLKKAGIALGKARQSGKIFKFYTQNINVRAEEIVIIEKNLFKALKKDEFILYYQPYYDINTRKISGMEALIRWNSKDLGVVSPAKFIPLLEENGMIIEVGKWILGSAIRQLLDWKIKGYIVQPISVNLSTVQFKQSNLVEMIKGLIRRYGIDPSLLVMEITETVFMHDVESAGKVLKNLKDIGVCISIDDFGTAYSTLWGLKGVAVDNLKIDISFIRELVLDPDVVSIVTAIINLAHNLNIRTIAEGVETAEQLKILRLLRCEMAQGYYFGKPLLPHEIERLFIRT